MRFLKRHRGVLLLLFMTILSVLPAYTQTGVHTDFFEEDSLKHVRIDSIYQTLTDSVQWQSELDFVRTLDLTFLPDSLIPETVTSVMEDEKTHRLRWREKDSIEVSKLQMKVQTWEPDPRKATWMALLFPGGGQIYNRKYWKLPIVYGGFVGCVYALTWNQSTYADYRKAYVDILDDDPDTKSYEEFLPPNYQIDSSTEDWLKDVFKKRKDKYRRYRDLSIFAFAGMYIISAIDAYVDAELSHFDISSDLSLKVEPNILIDYQGTPKVGLLLAFSF
ncbi:MAG TPA: DUF5683 domain-containing protein [Bacteroidaceae bacterium]|jgi:hypothetical protein|nr:DUF5683 domain-containing protein [Bacteroidaceae bacterium]